MSADPTAEELAAQLRERTAELAAARGQVVKLNMLCDHLQADLDARTRKLDALTKAVLRHRDAVDAGHRDAIADRARKMWALAATPATTATTGD